MATKKSGGSSSNGRKSAGKRLGIKVSNGGYVQAGSIIVRQVGSRYLVGKNAYLGRDYSIMSSIKGTVQFVKGKNKKDKSVVNIYEKKY